MKSSSLAHLLSFQDMVYLPLSEHQIAVNVTFNDLGSAKNTSIFRRDLPGELKSNKICFFIHITLTNETK